MRPNHHPVTRTRSLEPRRNNAGSHGNGNRGNGNHGNGRPRKFSGQRNSQSNPYVQVTGPSPREQFFNSHPPQTYSRGPQRTIHQSRDPNPSREVMSRVMSPPQSYSTRGYPQSPLARTTGSVFTFESRDHEQPPPRPREGLDLWSGTRSEPTTPKLLSPDGSSNPPAVMVPQRDSPFLHQRSLLGHFHERRNHHNPGNLRNISENLRSVTSVTNSPHSLSRNHSNRSSRNSRLNPMAPIYQPDHPYRPNLTHTSSLPASVPNSPMTSSNLSLNHVISRPRSVSPQPVEQIHSALRRNTLDTLHSFERVRSASPNPIPPDTFDDNSHSVSDPVINQPPKNLNLIRYLDSSTSDPYLNSSPYETRHITSVPNSRVTSPQLLDSPYPRAQKNSFESGYSSSSASSSNSGSIRKGGYGIVRRRTIGGGERERDRCSTPVSSPPLDQFVKARERSEVRS